MQPVKQAQILPNLCTLFSILQKHQNTLQAYRETLTMSTNFHPFSLFNYISRSQDHITRKHISELLQENDSPKSQEQIRLLFAMYGYKEKMDFNGFLNYLFPSCLQSLKYISIVSLKRYNKHDGEIEEEELCLFVLLIKKEIDFLHDFEGAKIDLFPRVKKNQIKRIAKLVKKASDARQGDATSENIITFNQMRTMIKKVAQMPADKIISICRRLSMNKDCFVSIDQLQFWLKPWSKLQIMLEKSSARTLFDDIEASLMQ